MNTLFERSFDNYKDEWLTPPHIFRALGSFDLDPCAPVVRPWPTAAQHYTIKDDGLTLPWYGRVWLNPPYSNNVVWMQKMGWHNNGIALIYARTDTEYFDRYVFQKAAGIMFLFGRLKFCNVDGSKGRNGAGAPSVLVAYGEQNYKALQQSNLHGKILSL